MCISVDIMLIEHIPVIYESVEGYCLRHGITDRKLIARGEGSRLLLVVWIGISMHTCVMHGQYIATVLACLLHHSPHSVLYSPSS